ncbi:MULTISPECIES: ABC transporter ATP-binding protein [Amycolatopsis]|uniref:ABC transporter ATP-binding protein n=1 Tax=Amycolatopsis TaxID=1813 RepID=UPI001C590AC0|nr:ABC transporter ATP-binding protein [Amycolatopsis sp. TNS106]QXV58530.1 hypothetical protein CVV72_17090 [Amycolatopsis sp. TNS106]
MAEETLIRLSGIHRRYVAGETTVHALRGVDVAVKPGELVAVLGPSGSGKSTLLLVAGGLERPDSGTVEVAGADLGKLSATKLFRHRRRNIGFVFQNYNLVKTLTVLENVMLPAELDGVNRREAAAQARAALATVDLSGLEDRFPDQLSGGQQQRVAISRALSGGRRVLLADEPTGALDSATAAEVLQFLRKQVDDGAAGMVVTHDAAVARWADRRIDLLDGELVEKPGDVR